MTVTLVSVEHRWECPNCPVVDVTYEPQPHTRFHACAGLQGLTAPLIEAGARARVTAVEREDYIGDETVTTMGGRPIQAVITERADGSNDVAVFAGAATAKAEEL